MRDLAIGIDVGSTTVKAVVVDSDSLEILWSDYRRHETRQAEMARDFLVRIGEAFADVDRSRIRVFVTGSGSGPLAVPLGARFVQEVNAVTLAVERMHPDVGSVVELGGQDAKIVMFRVHAETGERRATTSMNDKCASGTGATIDKCMVKVGMEPADVARLVYDPTRVHHVAAKCGVFAETDVVNLVKSGIPAGEIMNSLADAIVHQNLSVLTRGNTLRPKVLLLGGPNTYLPFLQACWRHRIPETWDERGVERPQGVPVDELIFVPENAQYYAAFGAVVYGRAEGREGESYRGLDGLNEFIRNGRAARLGDTAGRPLVRSHEELAAFREEFRIPAFEPPRLPRGRTVRAAIGLDGGSTSSKAVLVSEDGEILKKEYQLSRGNPIQDAKEILSRLRSWVASQGAILEVAGFGATGYAADVLESAVRCDVNIVETIAHMMSATRYHPDADVVCDIGGQDIKVLFLRRGDVKDFKLSNQCSAGNGMLLQAMADQFGVPVQDYAEVAFSAPLSPRFSYGCAVFLDADRVNFQKEGFTREELLAGLALVLPKNVWQYVVQVPRMAELGRVFVLQGGTQYNLAAVKAQVDYIRERVPGADVRVHPHPGEAGALGAAFEALRVVGRRGESRFIGIDAAIDLRYTTRNDPSTRCSFCPNQCSRTFIDAETPEGGVSRYISGFTCEKGTVESEDALKVLAREARRTRDAYPNLVDEECKLGFRHFYDPPPLPEAGRPVDDVEVRHRLFGLGRLERRPVRRGFRRSPPGAAEVRARAKVGIPRALNVYSTAPLWRTYFETLGLPRQNVVFSEYTSEQMFQEGGKYGSVDPCYPSKVAQAHIHDLLFHKHVDKRHGPLDWIFFPCVTHLPSFVSHTSDNTTCPIVAGAPNVMKAAFTKEVDFFARAGIEYLDPSFTLEEPLLFKERMYQVWGPRLDATRDESDFACDQGFAALEEFDRRMQARGRQVLDQVEREDRIAILLLSRPYHNDPGLNHQIPEEFQSLGYPILSIRSIPKDPEWLMRWFGEDVRSGRIADPFDIRDVWPENYSINSVQKVWAARFAARHPNVAVLDLSSFKCGHDAPTYGLIDSILKAGGCPSAQLHDIDANKPSGSIKIRVKTYAHSLSRHQERLHDLARKKAELQRLVDQRRAELLARRAAGVPSLRVLS